MNKPDLPRYGAEVDKLAVLPPATIEIPPVEALALITLVQAGMMSDRGIAQHGFTQIAVAGARKLQSLFSEDSETYTTSPKISNNKTQARKDDCMKVNYPERIEDTVSELKIIMSQQRTVTRQTKSSGTLFVKIWFEPEHYKCS